MAGSAGTGQGYTVPRPDNLENKRSGLRTTIRRTPKVAQREQSIPKNHSTGNMNPKMDHTKLPSVKSSTKKSSHTKTRKEMVKKNSKTKSRSAQKMKETPGTRPARFSPYAETEEPYLGGGFKASKVETEENEEEPLDYPLEHKGGCQLPDVPSNTVYGKVCVCITNMLSSETEEEYPPMLRDNMAQSASKTLTRYNMKKQVRDVEHTSSSSSSSSVLPTVKQPDWGSDYLQAHTTPSTYCDPNPEFESMFPPPPAQFPPIIPPADFTLPAPPLLKHASSSCFIPGQIPPKARDPDAIAIPTDLDSPHVCTEYYDDEFFTFIQRFKTLEADLIVRIHNWVLDLSRKPIALSQAIYDTYLLPIPKNGSPSAEPAN